MGALPFPGGLCRLVTPMGLVVVEGAGSDLHGMVAS